MSISEPHLGRLQAELAAAGLPVVGVASDGRMDFARPLSPEEESLAEQIRTAHDPAPTAAELRRQEYERQGISDHELVVALWEQVLENRPAAAEALQAQRLAVKASIPKE